MQTKLETVSSVKKKLTVDVPVDRVLAALEKAYASVQKKAKLKGFREGKVPRNLLELHFKGEAEYEAIDILVDSTYREALEKEAVNPISRPEVTVGPFSKDAPFSYTAQFEVHPIIEAKDYTGLHLEKTERNVTDELVDKRLAAMQRSMTQLDPAKEDTKLETGVVAFVDFNGTADGKPFEGSKADNFMVDVGGGSLLAEFEKEIVGMKAGESRTVEFNYPKDYFNKDLSGKKGVFNVKVKELKVKRVPELNDDFAKDLGEYKTLKEVKEDIKKRMISAVEHEEKMELANHALEELVKKHQFEVPESIVAVELKGMFEQFVRQLTSQGRKFEDSGVKVEQFIEQYKPVAENRVRGYYVLDAIALAEKMEVTEAETDDRIKVMAEQYKQPVEKIKEHYAEHGELDSLKMQLLHEKTLDFVVSKAKIKTKKVKK